jgi:hypothetical protein
MDAGSVEVCVWEGGVDTWLVLGDFWKNRNWKEEGNAPKIYTLSEEPVYRLVTGWTTEGLGFESQQGQESSPRRPDRL